MSEERTPYDMLPDSMSEIEYITPATPTRRRLTPRQSNLVAICISISNDMNTSRNRAEHHTAALLRLVADATELGYEAELVALARAWRREVEVGERLYSEEGGASA